MLLSVDIGTTKICGVAVSRSGAPAAVIERPNDAALPPSRPGRAEQDPGQIRDRVREVLRELRARVPAVTAIGLTGQMHGMLAVDAAGRPLTPLITWQDGRGLEPVAADGRTVLDLMRRAAPAEAWEACGCAPASGCLGCTLLWLRRSATLPRETARVAFVHDWIAGGLVGRLPVTDPTDAASAGIFDVPRQRWHAGLVQALDLPAELLPPVRPSGAVIGQVTSAAAAATGLPAGTPVCNAIGDNQASVLGSVADPERTLLVNLGTGGQVSWATTTFTRVAGLETRPLPPARYLLVGASLCGGRAYAWLNDVVRGWLGEFGHTPSQDEVYTRLNALAAAAPPGAAGLRAVTTLAGTRDDPSRRGTIAGIGLDNFTLGGLARAVLEGIADELAGLYEGAPAALRRTHDRIVASGNAVRCNPLLRRILAERFGRPVLVPRHAEEAAFGAALLAGVAAGVWADLAEAGRAIAYAPE